MISFAVSESDGSTSEIILTFSGNVHFRSSQALVFCTNNNIEPHTFNGVAFDETTESEVIRSKFDIEVEEILQY